MEEEDEEGDEGEDEGEGTLLAVKECPRVVGFDASTGIGAAGWDAGLYIEDVDT